MSTPGFIAEGSFARAEQHYRTRGNSEQPASGSVQPQQRHTPLKRPLLGTPHPAHTCHSITGCADMIWSGVCHSEGLDTLCTDDGCTC
jgi:hypothetical protein